MRDTDSPHTFPPTLIWLLIGLTLGWGFNWPMMKLAVTEMAPMRFRTLCLVAGVAGLFAVARTGGQRLAVPAGQWPRLIAMALFNICGWNICAIYGVSLMASGRAAILGYTMPVWSVPLSVWMLGEPFTRRRALGVALGLSGMLFLLGGEIQAVGRSPLGALCMLGAASTWAVGTVIMKRWPVDLPVSSLTAWQMVIGLGPILAIALFAERGPFNPFALSTGPLLGVLFNLVVAFNFCYWAWTKIAMVAPLSVSSLSVMMIPVVGVFSGFLVLGEVPRWSDYAALLLVSASLATVLRPSRTTTA
ncbi:MAG: DMT(drug/metabolite transporter) superfamily permease [candidate division NC10 bacterium]|nr:DMT(drug/metabolite transporter) superfamily permease [candidate division NC10 bacterium]